jgi:hypothetical protein
LRTSAPGTHGPARCRPCEVSGTPSPRPRRGVWHPCPTDPRCLAPRPRHPGPATCLAAPAPAPPGPARCLAPLRLHPSGFGQSFGFLTPFRGVHVLRGVWHLGAAPRGSSTSGHGTSGGTGTSGGAGGGGRAWA